MIESPTEALAGHVDVMDGHRDLGLARIRRALDDSGRAEHAPGMRASIVRLLLEAAALAGDARAGLAATDLALGTGSGARLWDSEAHRRRAEFLAALGASADGVEAELHGALEVARRQGAKMLELRAVTSLLRHRLDRGDRPGASQARALLAGIAAALAEARGTRELGEAAAVLARS